MEIETDGTMLTFELEYRIDNRYTWKIENRESYYYFLFMVRFFLFTYVLRDDMGVVVLYLFYLKGIDFHEKKCSLDLIFVMVYFKICKLVN